MKQELSLIDYDYLCEQADLLFRDWRNKQSGVRGQVINEKDYFDYWMMVATWQYALNQLKKGEE